MIHDPTKCPRCGGGMLCKESDSYGAFITCCNCGWCSDVATVPHTISETILTVGSVLNQTPRVRKREPSMTKLR